MKQGQGNSGGDIWPLLADIASPADVRKLKPNQLVELASEMRAYLIDVVTRTGGHLGASLGTVELTIALHACFDTPRDRLVWDVGHQAYGHKVLTGRRDELAGIRQSEGISGFLRRAESEYDAFGAGHSSTSISAALGMAAAARLRGEKRHAVAIIGDGAMTAGLAFEALNNAGELKDLRLLIVLNDNSMSISPNVGALNRYLTELLSHRFMVELQKSGKKTFDRMPPPIREFARRTEEHIKGMVIPGTLFDELGLHYFGPLDGHDLPGLVGVMQQLRDFSHPTLLHVVTRKGKGYPPAEKDPLAMHSVVPPAPSSPKIEPSAARNTPPPKNLTYTQVFGEWLCATAEKHENLIAITPAMREGSGLVEFSNRFPQRYFDTGIAEQHSLTFAAGLACEGFRPVVAIYSTFLQRAYDQLIHDICIQNLPVLLAIDRAGLAGADGATHHGAFDLSYLRCLPNMIVMAPANEDECRRMLETGFRHEGPSAVRYPRDNGTGAEEYRGGIVEPLEIGKGRPVRSGRNIAILSFGALLDQALEAAEELDATLIDMRFVKPLDEDLIQSIAAGHSLLATLEDSVVSGGGGSGVGEALTRMREQPALLHLGLPNQFIEHGTRKELLIQAGLDSASLVRRLRSFIEEHGLSP